MQDQNKTKKQLIVELESLRRQFHQMKKAQQRRRDTGGVAIPPSSCMAWCEEL